MRTLEASLVVVLVAASRVTGSNCNDCDSRDLIWAENGGGFRAMVANMGYANIFAKAGLITDTSSMFRSISANSASSWFLPQFFYSNQFFRRTLAPDPQDLYDFVLEWMDSFKSLNSVFAAGVLREGANNVLDGTILRTEVSLPDAIYQMLKLASANYGDPDFIHRPAGPDNRVLALSKTHLYVQSTLLPTSRTINGLGEGRDALTRVGPFNDPDMVYTVPLAFQYAVKDNYTFFFPAAEGSSLPLRTCVTEAPRRFSFSDWEDYPLYPGNGRDAVVQSTEQCEEKGLLSHPFGDETPTVAQIALSSSAFRSETSSMSPLSFVQALSVRHYGIEASQDTLLHRFQQKTLLTSQANLLYALADKWLKIGFCNQWPNACGIHDTFLSDGAISDGISLALHIGQHHSVDKGDKSKVLKVIITISNNWLDNDSKLLAYFNTTFNQGVEPGRFLWGPGFREGLTAQINPWRSPQIFTNYLDQETLLETRTPIPNSPVSSVRMTVTTISNPAYHVQAGQTVDLLLLFLTNSTIGINDSNKVPLAELAQGIAASEELLEHVMDFVSS